MSVDRNVGTVRGAWRYPVKSLPGERLASLELTGVGFVGDRIFGVHAESRAAGMVTVGDGIALTQLSEARR